MNTRILLLLALAMAAGAGCSPNAAPTPGTTATTGASLPTEATATLTRVPTSTDTPRAMSTATLSSATMTPTDSLPAELLGLPEVEQAKADQAQRLGVSTDDIEVVRVQPMTWTDSSMGCPQPDMAYLQVLVEGLLVQLSHAGQVYNYHSGGGQPPFLCEQSLGGGKNPPELDAGILTPPRQVAERALPASSN